MLPSNERHTLELICDTLAPKLAASDSLLALSAAELQVADALDEKLEEIIDPDKLDELRQFFRVLEFAPVNGAAIGVWKSFSDMSLEERTRVLRAWSNSPLAKAREAFQGVKRLTLYTTYALMPDEQPNPAWEAIDFSGAPGVQSDEPKPIQPLTVDQDQTLTTDVLIIGSGAGGGVVAGELSAAGYEVMIVEKGDYVAERDFTGHEIESHQSLYEKSAALASEDASISIFAGSTLGGGTTVNWMGSFRTPDHVLHQWEHDFGFTGAAGEEFQHSLDAVSHRINVNTDESIPNGQNTRLERGCQALGEPVHVIARNVKGCEDCGFCNMGCAFGAKQSTMKTYLQDAYQRGAKIVVKAHIDRVTHQHGVATGAVGTVTDENGKQHQLTIKAKRVVVAAGAIHTPALLHRSGLQNPQIGQNLFLHPVSVVLGEYDENITPWQGAPMTRYYKEELNYHEGYGYWIETPAIQPGLMALAMPWQSGKQHRDMMRVARKFATFIILTRDRYGGTVTTLKDGRPRIKYQLHKYDAKHLLRGIMKGIHIQEAAGAQRIFSPHNNTICYERGGEQTIDGYAYQVQQRGLKPNAFSLFSAHQMSSCRIAGTPEQGALNPNGESYEVKNLFVADGSILPTCAGINPMLSIMAASHLVAQRMIAAG